MPELSRFFGMVNDIAYAGEMAEPIKVRSVRPLDGYKLLVCFDNGEKRMFDFEPLLDMPCYQPLKDRSGFVRAYVDCGTVCWDDGDIDIAPETLYERSVEYTEEETA